MTVAALIAVGVSALVAIRIATAPHWVEAALVAEPMRFDGHRVWRLKARQAGLGPGRYVTIRPLGSTRVLGPTSRGPDDVGRDFRIFSGETEGDILIALSGDQTAWQRRASIRFDTGELVWNDQWTGRSPGSRS